MALGSGGMGAVYLAEHRLMERQVALKVINRDLTDHAGAVERFGREARAAARLQHPQIVAAFDAEQAGPIHFLVMEFVEGIDLARLVKRLGPLLPCTWPAMPPFRRHRACNTLMNTAWFTATSSPRT